MNLFVLSYIHGRHQGSVFLVSFTLTHEDVSFCIRDLLRKDMAEREREDPCVLTGVRSPQCIVFAGAAEDFCEGTRTVAQRSGGNEKHLQVSIYIHRARGFGCF